MKYKFVDDTYDDVTLTNSIEDTAEGSLTVICQADDLASICGAGQNEITIEYDTAYQTA